MESNNESLTDLNKRLSEIESRLSKSRVFSINFFPRSWAIFWHCIIWVIIFYLPVVLIAIPIYMGYINEAKKKSNKNITNTSVDAKSMFSMGVVKSKLGFLEVHYNTDKWKAKQTENGSSEYQFNLIKGDCYGLLITEKTPMSLKTLRNAAIENAKSVGTNVSVINESIKNINNKEILEMDMTGEMSGLEFRYHSYYWVGDSGCVQFVTYCHPKFFEKYKNDLDELLNGLKIF